MNEFYSPQIMGNEYYSFPKNLNHAENLSTTSREEGTKEKYEIKSDTATKDVHPTSDIGFQVKTNGKQIHESKLFF